MTEIEFRKKIRELFIGKRSLKDRFLTAYLPALVLSFILFLYGPLDQAYRAAAYRNFSIPFILPACLKIWAFVFAGSFIITWLLGGKMHAWLSSLMTGLAAAFYIQDRFWNMDLNDWSNSGIWWQDYHTSGFLNLFLFLLIVLIPFVIHYFSRKVWKRFVIILAVLLLALQLIPYGKMISEAYQDRPWVTARESEGSAIDPDAFQKLIYSSCYRYFPIMMKAPFQMDPGALENMKLLPEEESQWISPAYSGRRVLSIRRAVP